MSVGRALVTSAGGGAAELVSPGIDALTATPGDADALSGAIARLAGDRTLRETLGRSGRQTAVSRFSRDRFADEIAQVYARVGARMQAA
jgi:glycosyltransferase involved in cell wall biosynthesis